MATIRHRHQSPLSVKSRPPSLVVDRFHNLADEDELRLAAAVHRTAEGQEIATILARLAAIEEEFRVAARQLTTGSAH